MFWSFLIIIWFRYPYPAFTTFVTKFYSSYFRTDFMTLPFQSLECLLAHVEPVDGMGFNLLF